MYSSFRLPEPSTSVITGIDIYLISHEEYKQYFEKLSLILSEDEKARAAKYIFEKDRIRYSVIRGILRQICGMRLDIEPQNIEFDYTDRGQPVFKSTEYKKKLSFNVSHTSGYSVIALSALYTLGIDIESINRISDYESLVDSFFTSAERVQWEKITESDKRNAFFKWWVQKEAYLKWNGKGISEGFKSFSVDIHPTSDGKFTETDVSSSPQLKVWVPLNGYYCALCYA